MPHKVYKWYWRCPLHPEWNSERTAGATEMVEHERLKHDTRIICQEDQEIYLVLHNGKRINESGT